MTEVAVVVGAYGLGSIPFSWLLVRLVSGRDLRHVGSGNPGATNALRASGPGVALAALGLDVGKGVAAVGLARLSGVAPTIVATVAAAVVLGHVFPLFLGLRGGKGVAAAGGALGVLAPWAALASLVVFVGVVGVTRYVSLGSIVAVASFPCFVALASAVGRAPSASPAFVLSCTLVPLLVIARHRSNLRRLVDGTERRIGKGASP